MTAPAAPQPRLHPNQAALDQARIAELRQTPLAPIGRTEAIELVQSLVERATVRTTEGKGFEIELEGDLPQMIDLATKGEGPAVPDPYRSSVKLVAGAGFEPAAFRL